MFLKNDDLYGTIDNQTVYNMNTDRFGLCKHDDLEQAFVNNLT